MKGLHARLWCGLVALLALHVAWADVQQRSNRTMRLLSPAFEHNEEIPTRYTCEGEDISPPLRWENPPQGTVSFALIADDPDAPDPAAPRMTYVHWVVFNIPASVNSLPEGASKSASLPAGAQEGLNDWGRIGYGGPCPPIGRHRYFFKLYALDTKLNLDRPTKAQLEQAMKGHILATAELMGTYRKKRK